MRRDRAGVIIRENERILLIKRVKNHELYYVFPGGGIEQGETPQEAAKREAYEELGVHVEVSDCLIYTSNGSVQYYFVSCILGGELGTGSGAEFSEPKRGTYELVWKTMRELVEIDVRPIEMVGKLVSYSRQE